MKRFIFLFTFLFLINNLFSQQNIYYVQVEKSEFRIVTGMCLVGLGLSYQPILLKNVYRPFYHYPEITIPVTLGISLTITGVIDGIKKEKKVREAVKN